MTNRTTRSHTFHISQYDGNGIVEEGNRIAVQLHGSTTDRINVTLPLVWAERLAHSLLFTCAVARGGVRGEQFVDAYPSDEVRFVYDDVRGDGRLDFRARGQHGISILLSLDVLRDIRAAIAKVEK